MEPKEKIIELAVDLYKEYFLEEPSEFVTEAETENVDLSIHQRLAVAIEKRTANLRNENISNANDSEKIIRQAFKTYIATNIIPSCLQKIFDALILIKPTSIANERNFSLSGIFLTKNRKRLGRKTHDDLCFLKSYYIKTDQK